jgi:hypothetical protein
LKARTFFFFFLVASGRLPGNGRAIPLPAFQAATAPASHSSLGPLGLPGPPPGSGPRAPRLLPPRAGPRGAVTVTPGQPLALANPERKPNPNIQFFIKPEAKAVFSPSVATWLCHCQQFSCMEGAGDPRPSLHSAHKWLGFLTPAAATMRERPRVPHPRSDPAGRVWP